MRCFIQGLCAIVCLLSGGLLASASAQTAPPFHDDMAQRTLACTACHGDQGRAGPDGYYPRLAGKPAGYLYNQLLNFRDGRRPYGLMIDMVDVLSDAYLMEIAQHFAALDVPYPPPAAPAQAPAPALLQRGRTLALQGDAAQRLPACAACHGEALMGVQPRFPALLGLPADYLTAQLGGWKTGQRRAHAPDCMAEVVRRLSDVDAHAVVSWLASQPVPAQTHPAPAPAQERPPASDLRCGSAPLAAEAAR
ncbi:c-type cytochrome [Ottowia pentelensis]|uniref:C-type cytochrome n=1 Tax=Ottowia pentelensis TaxID=511108 RepID=A0ABV6PWC2_9BURK